MEPKRDPVRPKAIEVMPVAPPVSAHRPVTMLTFEDLQLTPEPTEPPIIEWMAPGDLLVEGAYQRDLSVASLALIRRITEGWDWRRFKPPIVAWTDNGFEIIDGQHTAIAASTRGIEKIPVLVVEAQALGDRASAFLGHNRDRLTVTPVQMHRAAVAAGDPDALAVQSVCDQAGVTILVGHFGQHKWKPGETIAVATIDSLVKRRGPDAAFQVLAMLRQAETAPVSSPAIKAVDALMNTAYFADIDLRHLAATIKTMGDAAEREARLDAKTHGIPVWDALGRVWFKKCKKIRKAA